MSFYRDIGDYTRAVFQWTTSQPTNSQVYYGTTDALGLSTSATSAYSVYNEITITGLDPSIRYYYRVKSVTEGGAIVQSDIDTFPYFSGVLTLSNMVVGGYPDGSFKVCWETNDRATSQVLYGLNTNYNSSSAQNTTLTKFHEITVTGLNPQAAYFFKAVSTTPASTSGIATTQYPNWTSSLSIPDVGADTNAAGSMKIIWNTDLPATSQLFYGTTLSTTNNTALDSNYVTYHSATVTGIGIDQTYYYKVRSTRVHNFTTLTVDSAIYSFTSSKEKLVELTVTNPLSFSYSLKSLSATPRYLLSGISDAYEDSTYYDETNIMFSGLTFNNVTINQTYTSGLQIYNTYTYSVTP